MNRIYTTSIAILSYFVLYAPQPLLPTFARLFETNIAETGALMTATLVPLAIAPLLYGYLLGSIPPARLVQWVLLAMGVSCIAFAYVDTYSVAVILRFCQGLLLPAVLTAITTSIGWYSQPDDLQTNMSWFVTGTILGGLLGRVLAGVSATLWEWRGFYVLLALALLMMFVLVLIPRKNTTPVPVVQKPLPLSWHSIASVLRCPGVVRLYMTVFAIFFSFVAVLNYLPFMLSSWLERPSEMLFGLMYMGFAMGAVSSLSARRIIVLVGSPRQVMMGGYAVFLSVLLLFYVESVVLVFCALFLLCGSMFLVHSIAVAEVNKRCLDNKSIANALYVSAYYSGGVLGSYIPGVLYEHYGQSVFLLMLLVVSGAGCCALVTVREKS